MTETAKVEVRVRYKEIEKTFSGNLEETWLLVDKFFTEFLPSFDIAKQLWLSVDLRQLTQDVEGLIAFSPEGANLLVPKNKLTDNETVLLWLLSSYLGKELGRLQSDSLSKEEIQTKLGKSGKITSTRLGELVKNDLVAKTADERFRITTFGVVQAQKEILNRIRTKMGGS